MADKRRIKSWADVPGFFRWIDRHVFAAILRAQRDSPLGTLVELGAYQGKSTVIIGDFVRPHERFVVVDLFGREDLLTGIAGGDANRTENRSQYANLHRQQFEENYLALHDALPEVVEGLTSEVAKHVEPASARFIHIDAGHLYQQVHEDIVTAKTLLRPGGIIAFDDFRTEHTPGVSAAVWQAVFEDGLIPVAVTPQKLYGVYDDPEPYQQVLRDFVNNDRQKRWWMQEQDILGRPVLRMKHVETPARPAAPRTLTDADIDKIAERLGAQLTGATKTPAAPRSTATTIDARPGTPQTRIGRYVAGNVAPPALMRWLRARRPRGSS